MNDRRQANIERVNDLWGLHKHLQKSENGQCCLAFVIDRRYLDGPEGVELRVGVSFGHNVVPPEIEPGLILLPSHLGRFVFGLHLIRTRGNQVTLGVRWRDARGAGDCTDAVQGEKKARAILESISDADYPAWVREWQDGKRPLKVSSRQLLEDFEIIEEGAF
jgi:hypothetical protein